MGYPPEILLEAVLNGLLTGAVYGLVAWVAACVVLAYVNVGWLIGLGGVLMMALPLLGAVMTAMWRATAMPDCFWTLCP